MSEPKRAKLTTVGSSKQTKNHNLKTVRLSINLGESNEDEYPELNYRDLVKSEEQKLKGTVENGKSPNDQFSDDEEHLQKIAKQFEQKYGSSNLYGKNNRTKKDDFADIGAGYDENDSFIDNTDGYDEMIPPECDTLYGGFYINCGSLDFKTVPGKRRLSSSSSSEDSSESSNDESNGPTAVNGEVVVHQSQKDDEVVKSKAKRPRRENTPTPVSDKNTSDDCGGADSVESDSQHSTADNVQTSDSSRDANNPPLPEAIQTILNDLKNANEEKLDLIIVKLEEVCKSAPANIRCAAWNAACKLSKHITAHQRSQYTPQTLHLRARHLIELHTREQQKQKEQLTTPAIESATTSKPVKPAVAAVPNTSSQQSKTTAKPVKMPTEMSFKNDREREDFINATVIRLKSMIDDLKPSTIEAYKNMCDLVLQEKRNDPTGGSGNAARRLPRRKWPWSRESRNLLSGLASAGGVQILLSRVLPLFPRGFVRPLTLLRQAGLDPKVLEANKAKQTPSVDILTTHKETPASQNGVEKTKSSPAMDYVFKNVLPELPSSITLNKVENGKEVTLKTPFNSFISAFNTKDKDQIDSKVKTVGSVTITPVTQIPAVKTNSVLSKVESSIRVKSPAALMTVNSCEIIGDNKKVTEKRLDFSEKLSRSLSPTQRDHKKTDIVRKEVLLNSELKISPPKMDRKPEIGSALNRIDESRIPRPELIPKKDHFKPPTNKKVKEVRKGKSLDGKKCDSVLTIDDSSSDIEVIEDQGNHDPLQVNDKDVYKEKGASRLNMGIPKPAANDKLPIRSDKMEETMFEISKLMQDLRDLQDSQDPSTVNGVNSNG